ncbi:uncharacterized protein C8Q71DRAFT_483332 [Rhodofomes roseus]|uniref:Ion transport domain-containing protein n=1 Tax=Rhodofomes roseus TaxID=34475 RepID=A0ABQ8KPA0_9APHY|nr:uncharacterized protein C8Q71DRAFT_483332 [Rhodofomes roseus]KAH9840257.1 hypothetical protein C8Q71DRAFT_483332 [Rhodofomes roseus]
MAEAQHERQPLLHAHDVDATEVYPIILMVPPDLTYTLVRPLEEKYSGYQRAGNLSIVFCLLVNCVYFRRDDHLMTAALSRTRAMLCEILAIRALGSHAHNMLELALAITTSWPVYSGAPPELIERAREERDDDLEERIGNAIEMAILAQAKRFTNSSACQKVIDGIWSGKIVYQADSSRSILSDTYKRTPIHFYDPHKAPLLDHYRLKVPAVRSVLELTNFLILFILFVVALEFNERDGINIAEGIFMIYALGFTLEKIAAMQEHGIKVYFKGTWNGFDLAFVTLYCTYAILRCVGIYHHHTWSALAGMDFLAIIAVLMFPRLAFVLLKDNVMVLALRAMIVQFVILMVIAAFCFGGFLYALWTLSRNQAGYTAGQIAWWMLDLWFGLDASGFDNASKFHPIFGPMMMVAYACLSNTLLLTILVSILSNTFATINDDATAEAMFRRAVLTIEGVKADSLFSYQPPINLIALCVMLPASYILTPRWFHKVNVFMIRLTSFPILLFIAWYERQAKQTGTFTFSETMSKAADKVFDTLPRSIKRMTFFEGLSGPDADIDAIFEIGDLYENSALDMEDADQLSPTNVLEHRRPSQASRASRRRVSQSHSQTSTPPRSALSLSAKSERPASGPSSIPLPRHRLNSLVTRGLDNVQSVASPLAQVFQPFVVEDENDPEQEGGALVSYGPASRRRLSSMQRRPTGMGHMDPFGGGPMAGLAGNGMGLGTRRSPGAPSLMSPSARLGLTGQTLSSSPETKEIRSPSENGRDSRQGLSQPHEPLETAEEEQEEGRSLVDRRLEDIEKRQQHIEELLERLVSKSG